MKKLLIFTGLIAFASSVSSMKAPAFNMEEFACLKANIFFEARGETLKGKFAVAAVTLNRVKSKHYPNKVCDTVFQRKQFSWTHQISKSRIARIMQGKVDKLNPIDRRAYEDSKKVAYAIMQAKEKPLPENVLHFHTVDVNPSWSKTLRKHQKIGRHIFYSQPSRKKVKNAKV